MFVSSALAAVLSQQQLISAASAELEIFRWQAQCLPELLVVAVESVPIAGLEDWACVALAVCVVA